MMNRRTADLRKRAGQGGFTALHLVIAVALLSLVAVGQNFLRGRAMGQQPEIVENTIPAEIALSDDSEITTGGASVDESVTEEASASSGADIIDRREVRIPVRSEPFVMGN